MWTMMRTDNRSVRCSTDNLKLTAVPKHPAAVGDTCTPSINPKDPEGLIWYTDAGSNSCFSIHPVTHVKEYPLLSAGRRCAEVNQEESHPMASTIPRSME